MDLPERSLAMRDALAVYGYVLMTSRKYGAARDLFRGMAVLFPDDRHVVMSLAVASLAAGLPEEALVLSERLLPSAAGRERPVLDFVLGKALFAVGRREEAEEALTRGLAGHEPPAVSLSRSAG